MSYQPNVLTTAGDLLDAAATGTWQRLGIGASGEVLTVSGGVPAWGAAGAGSGGALTLLASSSLASSAANITFSSIPGGYTSLMLCALLRDVSANTTLELFVQLNSDTGTNYDSSAGPSTNLDHMRLGTVPGNNAAANYFGSAELHLPWYTSTTARKTVRAIEAFVGGAFASVKAGLWHPTTDAAVTTIKLYTSSGSNLAAGCQAALYGVS